MFNTFRCEERNKNSYFREFRWLLRICQGYKIRVEWQLDLADDEWWSLRRFEMRWFYCSLGPFSFFLLLFEIGWQECRMKYPGIGEKGKMKWEKRKEKRGRRRLKTSENKIFRRSCDGDALDEKASKWPFGCKRCPAVQREAAPVSRFARLLHMSDTCITGIG